MFSYFSVLISNQLVQLMGFSFIWSFLRRGYNRISKNWTICISHYFDTQSIWIFIKTYDYVINIKNHYWLIGLIWQITLSFKILRFAYSFMVLNVIPKELLYHLKILPVRHYSSLPGKWSIVYSQLEPGFDYNIIENERKYDNI